MKKLNYTFFLYFFIISGLLISYSCEKDNEKDNEEVVGQSNATFLIGSKGSANLQEGLYKYTIGNDPVFLTSYYPHNYSSYFADENNGVVAFTIPTHLKDGTSGIVYLKVDEPDNIQFAPIPSAEEGFYYRVYTQTPQVLSDGRIAYRVSLETDSPNDSWFAGMIAIYNPESGALELSGDPTEFVLAQPEQGADTEDGTMKNGFTISPDDQFAYCEVYGYGTEGGIVHRDYSFIVRYAIGSPGSYSRIAQLEALPSAVTGDGNFLLLTGSFGLKKYDILNKTMRDVASYYLAPSTGQVSKSTSKVLRGWIAARDYGAGFGELNLNTNPEDFIHIIDEHNLYTPRNYYPDLDLGYQYSKDEARTYFGIYRSSQNDSYINICSSPIIELNDSPDSLDHISSDFDMNVFILLNE